MKYHLPLSHGLIAVIRSPTQNTPQRTFFRDSRNIPQFLKTEIQDKTKTAHTNASIQRNKRSRSQIRGKVQLLLPLSNRVPPLKYKTNWLIPEKKAPSGGKSFQLYTPELLTLLYGTCRLPQVDFLLPMPSDGSAGAALGNFEGKILRTSAGSC